MCLQPEKEGRKIVAVWITNNAVIGDILGSIQCDTSVTGKPTHSMFQLPAVLSRRAYTFPINRPAISWYRQSRH